MGDGRVQRLATGEFVHLRRGGGGSVGFAAILLGVVIIVVSSASPSFSGEGGSVDTGGEEQSIQLRNGRGGGRSEAAHRDSGAAGSIAIAVVSTARGDANEPRVVPRLGDDAILLLEQQSDEYFLL